jgi:hypothetical protein
LRRTLKEMQCMYCVFSLMVDEKRSSSNPNV